MWDERMTVIQLGLQGETKKQLDGSPTINTAMFHCRFTVPLR